MVSLVSAENLAESRGSRELRHHPESRRHQDNLAVAARALPESPDIESLLAEGVTLESALKKLSWEDTDVLVVGSSRFAAPKRILPELHRVTHPGSAPMRR